MGILSQFLSSWHEPEKDFHPTCFEDLGPKDAGPVNQSDAGPPLAPPEGLGLARAPPPNEPASPEAAAAATENNPQGPNTKLTGADYGEKGWTNIENLASVSIVEKPKGIEVPDITDPPFRCKQNLPHGPAVAHPEIHLNPDFILARPGLLKTLKTLHVTMQDVTNPLKPIVHWDAHYPVGAFHLQDLKGWFPAIDGSQRRFLPFCPKDDKTHTYELRVEGRNFQGAVMSDFRGRDNKITLNATRGPEVKADEDPDEHIQKKMKNIIADNVRIGKISPQSANLLSEHFGNLDMN